MSRACSTSGQLFKQFCRSFDRRQHFRTPLNALPETSPTSTTAHPHRCRHPLESKNKVNNQRSTAEAYLEHLSSYVYLLDIDNLKGSTLTLVALKSDVEAHVGGPNAEVEPVLIKLQEALS